MNGNREEGSPAKRIPQPVDAQGVTKPRHKRQEAPFPLSIFM
jgi:hypothetical protein